MQNLNGKLINKKIYINKIKISSDGELCTQQTIINKLQETIFFIYNLYISIVI